MIGFDLFLLAGAQVILIHLVLHSLSDVIEFDKLLCARSLINGRRIRLSQWGSAGTWTGEHTALSQKRFWLRPNYCLNSLHTLQDDVPRTHIQNVTQAMCDIQERFADLDIFVCEHHIYLALIWLLSL